MRKTLIAVAVLAVVGGGVALAASGTSEEVLKDPSRADCPGMIECPLTGEMICADECPLNNEAKSDGDVPPCCKDK